MRKLALSDEILLEIEKPARYIGGEVNSVMKDPEKVKTRFAMCFPDVYEDQPFEDPNWTAVRRCANRRCYALVFERGGQLCLNLKCEPMQAQFWRQVYPQVAPGYHMNKTHWNTVTLNAGLDDDALDGMIAHSYDLTAPKERKRR